MGDQISGDHMHLGPNVWQPIGLLLELRCYTSFVHCSRWMRNEPTFVSYTIKALPISTTWHFKSAKMRPAGTRNHRIDKGQLISKCFLVPSLSSKKRTKTSRHVVKTNLFVCFLEETSAWKNYFEFVWPLPTNLYSQKKPSYLDNLILRRHMCWQLNTARKIKEVNLEER